MRFNLNVLLLAAMAVVSSLTPVAPAIAQNQPTELETLRKQVSQDDKTLHDWAQLARYREENRNLAEPAKNDKRVVFMGDSITDRWGRQVGTFFPGKPYVNRGIGGQTTGQMLLRFQQDVIALKPKLVVIHAGTNDIVWDVLPADTEANLRSMVELAQVHHIRVILASLLPVSNCTRPNQTTRRPLAKLQELNEWMAEYAKANRIPFVDYFKATEDEQHLLRCALTVDGVHPSVAGYDVMANAVAPVIERTLR